MYLDMVNLTYMGKQLNDICLQMKCNCNLNSFALCCHGYLWFGCSLFGEFYYLSAKGIAPLQ